MEPSDVQALIDQAAAGDRAAQSRLVSECTALPASDASISPFEAISMAEVVARLAAAHGNPEDKIMLAGVLRCRALHVADRGDIERALALFIQSEALCDELATVPMCEGAEFLGGLLMAEIDLGSEAAEHRFDKLIAALTAGDADKLRHSIKKGMAMAAQMSAPAEPAQPESPPPLTTNAKRD